MWGLISVTNYLEISLIILHFLFSRILVSQYSYCTEIWQWFIDHVNKTNLILFEEDTCLQLISHYLTMTKKVLFLYKKHKFIMYILAIFPSLVLPFEHCLPKTQILRWKIYQTKNAINSHIHKSRGRRCRGGEPALGAASRAAGTASRGGEAALVAPEVRRRYRGW